MGRCSSKRIGQSVTAYRIWKRGSLHGSSPTQAKQVEFLRLAALGLVAALGLGLFVIVHLDSGVMRCDATTPFLRAAQGE
jgi:hypothetical protein